MKIISILRLSSLAVSFATIIYMFSSYYYEGKYEGEFPPKNNGSEYYYSLWFGPYYRSIEVEIESERETLVKIIFENKNYEETFISEYGKFHKIFRVNLYNMLKNNINYGTKILVRSESLEEENINISMTIEKLRLVKSKGNTYLFVLIMLFPLLIILSEIISEIKNNKKIMEIINIKSKKKIY